MSVVTIADDLAKPSRRSSRTKRSTPCPRAPHLKVAGAHGAHVPGAHSGHTGAHVLNGLSMGARSCAPKDLLRDPRAPPSGAHAHGTLRAIRFLSARYGDHMKRLDRSPYLLVLPHALRDRIDALRGPLSTQLSVPLDRAKVIRLLLDRGASLVEREIREAR